jgi:hypothetical protein
MSTTVELPWARARSELPLCDIPWLGTATIHASGDVSYCCNSPTTVGNVNSASFRSIWTGPRLQQIRATLAAGALPPECRTSSCPLLRGDRDWYVLRRMHGPHAADAERLAAIRSGLANTVLRVTPTEIGAGATVHAALELGCSGPACLAELVLGVRPEGGAWRFLPGFEDFPVPCVATLSLAPGLRTTLRLFAIDAQAVAPGTYEVCAAVAAADSNLNLVDNAYWAGCARVCVRGQTS